MSDWQGIGTAPKDHSNFLAFGDQHGTCIAYWGQWKDNLKEEECEGWLELGTYDKSPGADPLDAATGAADRLTLTHKHRWSPK